MLRDEVKSMHRPSYKKGLTLMELLVAMTVLVIIAVIALPSFRDLIQTNRVRLAGDGFHKELLYARTTAIKNNVPVYLVMQTGSNWCYGANTSSTCNCNTTGSCNLGATTSSNFSGVSMSTSGFSDGNFIFNPVRASSDDSGTVTFTQNGKSIIITVLKMGTPTICSSGIGGYPC